MYVEKLYLKNFRNYNEILLDFSENVNILYGDNAQGKTNILEAIYYCSLARSHRTNKDRELVNFNYDAAYINTIVNRSRINKNIEVKIFKEGKKGINVNSRRLSKVSELIGSMNVVMFSPEDLKIIKDSPVNRRKMLDMELCQLNYRYYFNLSQYNKVLNERNAFLRKFNDKNINVIDIYDCQLSKFGAMIIKSRYEYIKRLNINGEVIHNDITSGKEKINFKYMCPVDDCDNIEDELLKKIVRNRKNDIERRTTTVGPHRDDFEVYINGRDVRKFGSQGQQRTAVLTIKFSSLNIIKENINEYPILLLDDVLSELDSNRQNYILNSIKNIQTIITCTSILDIKSYIRDDSMVYNVKEGMVSKVFL